MGVLGCYVHGPDLMHLKFGCLNLGVNPFSDFVGLLLDGEGEFQVQGGGGDEHRIPVGQIQLREIYLAVRRPLVNGQAGNLVVVAFDIDGGFGLAGAARDFFRKHVPEILHVQIARQRQVEEHFSQQILNRARGGQVVASRVCVQLFDLHRCLVIGVEVKMESGVNLLKIKGKIFLGKGSVNQVDIRGDDGLLPLVEVPLDLSRQVYEAVQGHVV